MREYEYTHADGTWITDPEELNRVNAGYWDAVAERVLVDQTSSNRKRLVRAWAVQVGPSEWVVQYLVTYLGKSRWAHAGKRNGPYLTESEARRGVAEVPYIF
jgi:hypothetical protein